jgi:hypothetical protein
MTSEIDTSLHILQQARRTERQVYEYDRQISRVNITSFVQVIAEDVQSEATVVYVFRK